MIGINAQTTITFSEAGFAAGCNGNAIGDSGATVSLGSATDPANDYLTVNYGAVGAGEDWKNGQVLLENKVGHTFKFDNQVLGGAGTTMTFKIWTEDLSGFAKNTAGDPFTGMLKLELGAAAKEYSFDIADTGGWQDITVDLGTDKAGNAVAAGTEFNKIVFFANYGVGSVYNAGVRHYDDISFSDGAAIAAADTSLVPTTAAPTPTHGSLNTTSTFADASDVLNFFSDHYPSSINWCDNLVRDGGWAVGGATTAFEFLTGDAAVVQNELSYVGSYWNRGDNSKTGDPLVGVDISSYANMNIDIYFQELTGTDHELGIALLTLTAGAETLVKYPIAAGAAGWRTLTLDLSEYGGLTEVVGIKIEGLDPDLDNDPATDTRWTPDITWDNLFAWNPPSQYTVASFAVDANNAGAIFDAAAGEVFAISYSVDGGNTYQLSNPLSDADNDGVWTGDVQVDKDGTVVQYKVVTTDNTSGYLTAIDSSADALASDADFSFTANANTSSQEITILDRDTGSSFATLTSSAVVNVNFTIRGLHPDHNYGQFGVRPVGGSCYGYAAVTGGNEANGFVHTGVMEVPFYSTRAYNIGFHNGDLAADWCTNVISQDANTDADFSVTVVEADVSEDLSALSAVDANDNFIVYTSSLSFDDISVELTIYPNPADQFIAVKSSEILSGLRVIDMTGKEVIRKSIQSNDTTLDLGNLNTGIYFLEAKAGKATETMRFIKK